MIALSRVVSSLAMAISYVSVFLRFDFRNFLPEGHDVSCASTRSNVSVVRWHEFRQKKSVTVPKCAASSLKIFCADVSLYDDRRKLETNALNIQISHQSRSEILELQVFLEI